MSTKLKKQENPEKDMRGSLDAQLLAYCAVAGGALLAAQPADAAIFYSGVKNLTLTDNNTVILDLDSNGVADFKLKNNKGKSFRVETGTTTCSGIFTTTNRTYTGTQTFTSTWTSSGFPYTSTWTSRNTNTHTYTHTGTYPCPISTRVPSKDFTRNTVQPEQLNNALAAQGVPADPAKLRLGQGAVIPGQEIGWIDGNAGLSFSSLMFSDNDKASQGATTNKAVGGPFFGRKGYLGVKFKIDNATHYGWIRYQGDDSVNTADNATQLKATVIDWAYEKLADTPIAMGQQISNCVTLSPARISKVISIFEPIKTIVIKGDASTTFTSDTAIDWGTAAVTTLFKVPLGKSTLLAVVRVKPSQIKKGDTFEVTVDDCIANLTVGF